MLAEIHKTLQQGVITESQSPWRSPIIAVPKPDRTWHLCVYFWKLNVISQFDAFPMPHISELLEKVGQAKFISTFDLIKGYRQVPLRREDQAEIAFGTPRSPYEFKCMPFGLHGQP